MRRVQNSGPITVTRADDEAEILRLDSAWNEAYRRHDRAPLAHILADDFTALDPSGEPFAKAKLMVNPPGQARSVIFSEQSVRVFGETGISRGRLQLELDDRRVDHRFLRVFAKRDGIWQAVSVSVTPVNYTIR
jgi:ketosteroid isomerase-like protein